jgi:Tfp pilus assembly protein PilV
MTRRRIRLTRPRSGLTIVELMVAILVLSVGLLTLAGFSFSVTRQLQSSGLQGTAALVVQSRLDSLSSIHCATLAPSGPQSGTATTMGVTERWAVFDGNDIKVIVDTVTFKGKTVPLVYQTIIPCRD